MDRGLLSDGTARSRRTSDVPETRSTASSRPRQRLRGVDAARAVAVLGMVMVHFGPNPAPDTALGNLYDLSHGRASVLFALLAGVGVALLVGDRLRGGWPSLARGRLVLRGVLLLPLGLWLQDFEHGAFVILQYYALYFLFLALVLTFPDRWLLVGGATVLVAGPLVYLWGQTVVPEWYVRGDPASLDDPISKIAGDLLLTGTYPLVTWAAPLLVGAACTLWRAVLPRGPLEAALAAPWWVIERLLQPIVGRLAAGRGAGGTDR